MPPEGVLELGVLKGHELNDRGSVINVVKVAVALAVQIKAQGRVTTAYDQHSAFLVFRKSLKHLSLAVLEAN